jgi:hypothetical protein
MSNNQIKYQSIYGAVKPITAAQYLVELIIQRRAKKSKVYLPPGWYKREFGDQYKYWTKIWNYETKFVKQLFEKYDPQCVIDAFNSHDCQMILSANNKKLAEISAEFQRRKKARDLVKEETILNTTSTTAKPRQPQGKQNRLSKLRDE